MKKSFYSLLLGISLSCGMFSCSDGSVGSSISQTNVEIVMDSSFTLTGASVQSYKILSRTSTQLLGILNSDVYGEVSSDIVTQFMPAINLDTLGVTPEYIDSIKLFFRIPLGGFTGDSLVPMRVNVYRLNKQLPDKITSDFNPEGYYSSNDILGSTSYSASALGLSDSIQELTYRDVIVKLPREFGVDLYNKYKQSPETFATPDAFAKYFPGIYATTSYGSGRMMNINNTEMTMYYRSKQALTAEKDTIYNLYNTYLAATPEVITNNNIHMKIAPSILDRVAKGEVIVQAPAALDATIEFPIQEIIDKFLGVGNTELKVVNNLYFEIPASLITNTYGIKPPPNLLLVKTSEKDKFFDESKITDNKTSFYAVYDSSSKKYIFSEMRDYVLDIINNKAGVATDEDKKLTLTPVAIQSETNSSTGTSYITSITPYVASPVIVKLDLDKAKIKLTYSNQTSKL